MPTKKRKAGKNSPRNLIAKSLSGKRADKVKGGAVAGAHYKTVTLSMRKAGGDPH